MRFQADISLLTNMHSFCSFLLLAIILATAFQEGVFGQELKEAVGKNQVNNANDIRLVQKLLNQVPSPCGGPKNQLQEDGVFGKATASAISRFQITQLGFSDSVVEPKQRTIERLMEFKDFANQDRAGPKIAWGKRVAGPFKSKVLEICQRLEMDPNHLMAAMAFESAGTFSPAIKNAAGSGATGLIQFMPRTAKGLGKTTGELAKMSAVEQLDYVEKYFKPYKGKCKSVSDVYMAILWPAAIGKPESFVLFDEETKPQTYKMNKGLDSNSDGNITKLEAAVFILNRLKKGLDNNLAG